VPLCLEIITVEDLHRYTDGLLPRDRQESVGAYLQDDDEAFQRVEAYRIQIAELHRWLSPALREPVPKRLLSVIRPCEPSVRPLDTPDEATS
jgi:anti-sigma factor RsiW